MNKEEQQSKSEKQSNQDKKYDFTERNKLLDEIKARVSSKGTTLGLDGALFELFVLVGSVGDIIGREFYFEYDYNGKIVKLVQKPIRTKTLLILFKEFQNYIERQEKVYKKQMPKTLGRRR